MNISKKTIRDGLLSAIGVTVYVALVAQIMINGDRLFGEMSNVLGPVAFLLLFIVSAAVTSSLVFGRPAILFMSGQRKEAIELAIMTVAWLAFLTLLLFAGFALFA